jgi:hypothetical protein
MVSYDMQRHYSAATVPCKSPADALEAAHGNKPTELRDRRNGLMNDLQHCAACEEEYVAGVAACVECGQPLLAGPLPRGTVPTTVAAPVEGANMRLDRLLVELPGAQADQMVRALLLEEIACRVECEGVAKVYRPGQPPNEPFAVTLPVIVYVDDATYESGQEIAQSLAQEDVIGDQWSTVPDETERAAEALEAQAERDTPVEPGVASNFEHDHVANAPDAERALSGPTAESTSLRTVVLIVVAGIVLLFLFAR